MAGFHFGEMKFPESKIGEAFTKIGGPETQPTMAPETVAQPVQPPPVVKVRPPKIPLPPPIRPRPDMQRERQ